MEAHTAAIRNGSLLTKRRPAWVTVSSTTFGRDSPLASSEDSVVRLMAEQHGRLRLAFLTLLSGVRLMLPATAIFLSVVATVAAAFGAFAQQMRKIQLLRQHLIRSP